MDVSVLERAADTLLAAPNVVSAEDRRTAEQLFQDMKREMALDDIFSVIQQTKHPFVLFELAQIIGLVTLRQWPMLEAEKIEHIYKTLIQFVADNCIMPPYVTSEFLRSAAMILKRGILDRKTGDPELVFQLIQGLLTNQSPALQALGCQLISALTEQFSSSWGNSKFAITWDFHIRAKTEFENTGLRRLLELSLETLHALSSQSDIIHNEFERRLCDKFLEVAENIFSWNFATRIFRRLFSMNQTTNSFRPPSSWNDLLHNNEFFELFFKLHSKVRGDDSLCIRSLSCLIQLAGLSGDAMNDPDFSAHFVQLYIHNLLLLFPEGPSELELSHFCTIIHRLFLFRPVQSLVRLPDELRNRFFSYLVQYMQHLIAIALNKAIGEGEHSEHTSLALLFDSWVLFLRGRWRQGLSEEVQDKIECELMKGNNWELLMSFVKGVQGPPTGTRPKAVDEDAADEDDADDVVLFKDLLSPVGSMALYSYENFANMMKQLLGDRRLELTGMMAGTVDTSRLPEWQEDMHWLMMLIANSVVGEEMDSTCHVQQEVFDHSLEVVKARGSVFSDEVKQSYLCQCIEDAGASRPLNDQVDIFIQLLGEVLSWSSLEHQLLLSAPERMSPQLACSTLIALKRLVAAASHIPEAGDESSLQENDPTALPLLFPVGPFNDMMVRFVLAKVFSILNKCSGEKKLCTSAVQLLIGLVESRASALASSAELFDHLGSVDVARLPSRTCLMRALVLIGAGAADTDVQQNMYVRILEPLAGRFSAVVEGPTTSSSESELVDLLQCFDGVAKGTEMVSAPVLFHFLYPIISKCSVVLKSYSHCQPVTSAVLHLMRDVTTRVAVHIESETDSMVLYQSLLTMVQTYRSEQMSRFVGMSADEEDKGADLVVFMEILSNVLSKDILEGGEGRVATGAKVCLEALEMLVGVMTDEVLQMPEVALKFYRFVLYLVEFSPEAIASMNPNMLILICNVIKAGVSSKFGQEVCSLSLESMSEIAQYLYSHRELVVADVHQQLVDAIPLVFSTALEYSCENSMFSDASAALFNLIQYSKEAFEAYVSDLLSRKSNADMIEKLRAAFVTLMNENATGSLPIRRQRLAFRSRMEKFVSEIQGLLICD